MPDPNGQYHRDLKSDYTRVQLNILIPANGRWLAYKCGRKRPPQRFLRYLKCHIGRKKIIISFLKKIVSVRYVALFGALVVSVRVRDVSYCSVSPWYYRQTWGGKYTETKALELYLSNDIGPNSQPLVLLS